MRSLQNVTLLELLPPSIAGDPNVAAAAAAVDAELRKATEYIPRVAVVPRMVRREITSHALLSLLAWQYHVDFWDESLPLKAKQEMVAKWLDIHMRKGTPSAVEDVVTIVFADAIVDEWFDYDGNPYCFKVGTEITDYDEDTITKLVDAIFSVKNTRSWLDMIEIIRGGGQTMYLGAVISQEVTTTVDITVTIEVQRAPRYYAAFVAQRPTIIIGEPETKIVPNLPLSGQVVVSGGAVTISLPYLPNEVKITQHNEPSGIIIYYNASWAGAHGYYRYEPASTLQNQRWKDFATEGGYVRDTGFRFLVQQANGTILDWFVEP